MSRFRLVLSFPALTAACVALAGCGAEEPAAPDAPPPTTVSEKAGAALHEAKDKAAEVGAKAVEGTGKVVEKTGAAAERAGEKLATDAAASVKANVGETASKVVEGTGKVIEKAGAAVEGAGKKLEGTDKKP